MLANFNIDKRRLPPIDAAHPVLRPPRIRIRVSDAKGPTRSVREEQGRNEVMRPDASSARCPQGE